MEPRGSQRLGTLISSVEERVPGLIENAAELIDGPARDVIVRAVTQDSREAEDGTLFCAIVGHTTDGHDFVASATDAGATAVLVDRPLLPADSPAVEIYSADTSRATGFLAAALMGFPADDLSLVGVTGTNGKTSIVSIIGHLVSACGGNAASMGTLTGSLTTAAAPQFQQALAQHKSDGATVVAAEISSHALDQQRVAGAQVEVAVFSNLTQDHLDYHADMEEYFEAKALLFAPEIGAHCVIDVSDSYGQRLADRVEEARSSGSSQQQLVRVEGDATVAAGTLRQGSSTFTWRDHTIELPLGGAFSVNNALLAAEAVVSIGYSVDDVAQALSTVAQIPGRFESVDAGQPFAVVVDYSHTPASVAAAIESARQLSSERVIIVFGAGGDRDSAKRPLMGEAASAADVLFVTSDNPRTEDPARIINEVMAGVTPGADVHSIVDRSQAISSAIAGATPGDIVVIAGKGHEDYQVIGTERINFDDRVEARAALAARGWGSNA